MKNLHIIKAFLIAGLLYSGTASAGNPDRVGQAGATELLINPWARSTGWGNANSGAVRGLEATFLNVAGIAHTAKTDVGFAHTSFLRGSQVGINAFGLTQRVGESSVMGLTIMSMDYGDIDITTTSIPEGGIGTFKPQMINIGLSYAKAFSNSIFGGFTVKIINENISNVGAQGLAVDAGIQYVTGTNESRDNIRFGIALKNVGTPMKYGGDGLSTRLTAPSGNYTMTIEQRTEGFEIPSLLSIGAAYDFKPAENHRITTAASYCSNSFSNDQTTVGVEYAFREFFMLRGGFTYEKNIFDDALRATVFTGPSAGMTLEAPLGKSGKKFSIDYSIRFTNPFDNTHTFGAKLTL
ncbi:MAG: PorV/PorQ family protein [Bacteroidota bacterium]